MPREGLRGQVDEILDQLGVDVEVDSDGDWRLRTEVGEFLLVVDGDNGDLVALQTIQEMPPPRDAHVDLMYLLLRMNVEARGACFAALQDGDDEMLVLAARVAADDVDRATVEAMLAAAKRISGRLDELTAG